MEGIKKTGYRDIRMTSRDSSLIKRPVSRPATKADERHGFLESIVARAVDTDSIAGILEQFEVERSISAPEVATWARQSSVRVHNVNGTEYIFCPVPLFYDEERGVEIGFAIDVDQDHFDVYPYLFKGSNEYTILTKLPHCVVRAIKIDATSYEEVTDTLKDVANESSAILFISNLYTELEAGARSPVEFFDDGLFQQLLTRVLGIKGATAASNRLITIRFDQLLRQLDGLDESMPSFKERRARALVGLGRFLFDTVRVVGIDALFEHVDREKFGAIIDNALKALIDGHELAITLELILELAEVLDPATIQATFAVLVSRGHYNQAMKLETRLKHVFGKDEGVVQQVFEITIKDGLIDRLPALERFFDTHVIVRPSVLQQACNDLVREGSIARAMELERVSGMKCQPEERDIEAAYSRLLSVGKVDEAIALETWTGVAFQADDERQVQSAINRMIVDGDIDQAIRLAEWIHTSPSPDQLQVMVASKRLVRLGRVDEASRLVVWAGFEWTPVEADVQEGYARVLGLAEPVAQRVAKAKAIEATTNIPVQESIIMAVYDRIFTEAQGDLDRLHDAAAIHEWSDVSPPRDIVQDAFKAIFVAMRDNQRLIWDAQTLAGWAGTMPKATAVLAEYKHYLKQQIFQTQNISMVLQLASWTGMEIPAPMVQDGFTSLLSPPIRSDGLTNAEMLSEATGLKPPDQLVQETFRCIFERQVIDIRAPPVVVAQQLSKWTGIEPSPAMAKTGQEAALFRGDIAMARDIESWLALTPANETILDAYRCLFQSEDADVGKISELEAWTGVAPTNEMVQEAYCALILKKWITSATIAAARALHTSTGIVPDRRIIELARARVQREEELDYSRDEISALLNEWEGNL
jgi:hypothetical protein